MSPRPEVLRGHTKQVEEYAECARQGREETHGVLAGGDWNEPMDSLNPVRLAMTGAGLRMVANTHLDALFATPNILCRSVEVLRPPEPADHPWLLVTVEFEGHSVRVLIANTHVGLAIPLLAAAKRKYHPHLVLTCENGRPVARKALRKAFPRLLWAAVGFQPKSTGPGSTGTMVLARRDTWRLRASGNPLVSPYLDRMHPVRRCTWADLRHRRARVSLRAISAHTWTLHG